MRGAGMESPNSGPKAGAGLTVWIQRGRTEDLARASVRLRSVDLELPVDRKETSIIDRVDRDDPRLGSGRDGEHHRRRHVPRLVCLRGPDLGRVEPPTRTLTVAFAAKFEPAIRICVPTGPWRGLSDSAGPKISTVPTDAAPVPPIAQRRPSGPSVTPSEARPPAGSDATGNQWSASASRRARRRAGSHHRRHRRRRGDRRPPWRRHGSHARTAARLPRSRRRRPASSATWWRDIR